MAQDPQQQQNDDNVNFPILGMGNPLLDISSTVDDEFMAKYKIKAGNAILAEESHLPMYDELSDMETVEYIGGGSTLNTMRVCQWMCDTGDKVNCSYIGCIGSEGADTNEKNKQSGKKTHGVTLKECVSQDKVYADLFEHPLVPTGTCAVCITDKERSLVANLSAANEFKLDSEITADKKKELNDKLGDKANEYQQYRKDYFQRLHKRWENAQIVYTAGFFSTVSPETMQEAGRIQFAKKDKNVFAVNFSAPFVVQFFKDAFNPSLDLASHCFTNDDELRVFAKANGMVADDVKDEEINVEDIVAKISLREYSKKENDTRRKLTVICTQGKNPTIVGYEGKTTKYDVPVLDADKIVDLNGAGDAFVGGFLAYLHKGSDVETCVKAGNYAARCIIQTSGTNLTKLGKPKP